MAPPGRVIASHRIAASFVQGRSGVVARGEEKSGLGEKKQRITSCLFLLCNVVYASPARIQVLCGTRLVRNREVTLAVTVKGAEHEVVLEGRRGHGSVCQWNALDYMTPESLGSGPTPIISLQDLTPT